MPTDGKLIGVLEAASKVGVTPATLRNWVHSGRLTAYRVGPRLLKIDENELGSVMRPVA